MVLVETVGVGQSETEIAELADTVVFAVQPGSGDSLQFMKAGIVEIPDVALVTKADLGGIAERAKRDLEGALGLVPGAGEWAPPVLLVSANDRAGDRRGARRRRRATAAFIAPGLAQQRARQARAWLERWVHEEFGRRGAARLATELPAITADQAVSPFRWLHRAGSAHSG